MKSIEIPFNDPSWLRLPDPVREEALDWAALLEPILGAPNKLAAFREAARGKTARRGFSKHNIKTRFWKVVNEGWSGLVDWAKVPGEKGHPPQFIEWWVSLQEQHQRDLSGAAAFDVFTRQYRRWLAGDHAAAIPGWSDCPQPDPKTGLPSGCSYGTLIRIKSSKAERALARRGIAAAREFLPHCPQDVSQVRPLEYVIFDNVELDFLVQVPGVFQPVKIRLLVAMDLCSRVILGYGIRPAIPRAVRRFKKISEPMQPNCSTP